MAGKPVRLFASQPAGTGLHLVSVPSTPELEKTYLPGGGFTHEDYPTLIAADQTVETVGVGVALAVFAWPPGTARYKNLVTFVDAFFNNFPALLKPPHHPVWHNVNLAAAQPGWIRFAPAAAWLAQHSPAAATVADADHVKMNTQFDAFMAQRGVPHLTPAQREATWQYFQQQRLPNQ